MINCANFIQVIEESWRPNEDDTKKLAYLFWLNEGTDNDSDKYYYMAQNYLINFWKECGEPTYTYPHTYLEYVVFIESLRRM